MRFALTLSAAALAAAASTVVSASPLQSTSQDHQQVSYSSNVVSKSGPSYRDGAKEEDFVDILLQEAEAIGIQESQLSQMEHTSGLSLHQPNLASYLKFKRPQPSADALGPPGSGWTWSSCNSGDEIVEVESIAITPDPPRPGQNLTVIAKGVVSEEISDGSVADVVVKLGLIKLLTKSFDVCEEARVNKAEIQCPVSPGEYQIQQTVALPREIPPAKFNVHITGANQDMSPLICLDLSINFMRTSL